jgi:hypothetical protein
VEGTIYQFIYNTNSEYSLESIYESLFSTLDSIEGAYQRQEVITDIGVKAYVYVYMQELSHFVKDNPASFLKHSFYPEFEV